MMTGPRPLLPRLPEIIDCVAVSASPPLASEQVSQNNADSGLAAVTTVDSSEVSRPQTNLGTLKPDVMGVWPVVEIDTTGGPEFGLQHLKGYDLLPDREVVLSTQFRR